MLLRIRELGLALGVALLLALSADTGCNADQQPIPGSPDGGSVATDAGGTSDGAAGSADAAPIPPLDGGPTPADAGMGDAGFGDAGLGDAGFGDAGFGDAGFGDAGFGDAGFGDAGPGDAGLTDAGAPDAPALPQRRRIWHTWHNP